MTNSEKEEIKILLQNLITEISKSIKYLEIETQPIEPSVSLGRLTRMEAISEKGVNEAMLSSEKLRLERLANAMKRIENNTYGLCVRCGKEIATGRLRIIPEALVCITCLEKKGK